MNLKKSFKYEGYIINKWCFERTKQDYEDYSSVTMP